MKKIDLGQSVNTLANLGVIVGIAFLALELQQNNALLEAESLASMVSMNTEIWSTSVDSAELVDMLLKDRQGETLTVAEEVRLNALWVRALYNAEYIFEQAPERFPSNSWRQAFFTYGALQRAWDGDTPGSAVVGKHMFTDAFVAHVESEVLKINHDRE